MNTPLNQSSFIANLRKQRARNNFRPGALPEYEPSALSYFSKVVFNETCVREQEYNTVEELLTSPRPGYTTWINIAGVKKNEIQRIGDFFKIHPLIIEDILSRGQHAKADDMGDQMFALLPRLYFNSSGSIQVEQVSIVIGKDFLISFQEEASEKDFFKTLKSRLQNEYSPIRKKKSDYAAYAIIDSIVDEYFAIFDRISDRLDAVESGVMKRPEKSFLLKLSLLRQELMLIKRNIMPVRELIIAFRHTDNHLITQSNRKYFKDVYDHISLAITYNENYRDSIINLQDLYMNQVNARMNEIMKILTVVTTVLAPITVISSIYGMNFKYIPFSSQPYAFFAVIGIMLLISGIMVMIFKRKGWF